MIESKRNFLGALLGTAALVPTLKFPTSANAYDSLKCCWSWYESRDILNGRPIRKKGIAANSKVSFTVLSDSSGCELLRLNPMAARIWELCDGRNRVEDMVAAIVERYEVLPRTCATDVVTALTALRRNGLIAC